MASVGFSSSLLHDYIYVGADQSLGERISPCEVEVSKKTSKLTDDSLSWDVPKMLGYNAKWVQAITKSSWPLQPLVNIFDIFGVLKRKSYGIVSLIHPLNLFLFIELPLA